MTDLPQNSESPEEGWYPDPVTGTGHRYWNGFAWTDEHSLDPGGTGGGIQPVGPWFSESVRLVLDRSFDLFKLIAVLVLPTGLLSGILLYLAVRDARVLFTYDQNDVITDIGFDGFRGGMFTWAVFAFLLNLLASFVLAAAVSRQVVFARTDRPEAWTQSLVGGLKRSPRVLGVSLLLGLGLFLLLFFTVLFWPLLLITVPLAVFFVVRLALATTSAAVAPKSTGAVANSIRLTSTFAWAILGRLLLMLFVVFAAQLVIGMIAAPFGGGSATFQNGDPELPLGDFFGGNLGVYGFQQVVGGLVSGFASALYGAGMAVLYLDRGGELDEEFAMPSPF